MRRGFCEWPLNWRKYDLQNGEPAEDWGEGFVSWHLVPGYEELNKISILNMQDGDVPVSTCAIEISYST
jgi:hypothetical protein